MGVWLASMSVYHVQYNMPTEPEEGIRYPEIVSQYICSGSKPLVVWKETIALN